MPSRDDAEDRRLVERFRGGDVTAFDELYGRLKRITYAMLLRATDKATAHDLQQDLWLRVANGLHTTWKPEAPPRAWILTILHNLVRDHRRKHREILSRDRDSERGGADEPMVTAWKTNDGQDADSKVRDPFLLLAFDACIGSLDPEQKEVVLMHVAELSFPEISEITGEKLPTVKRRWQLALGHLKACLLARKIAGPAS